MLVLSRKQNERIVVGGSVVVTVVRISGDKVRLGIEAPADIRVIRDEVAEEDDASLGVLGGLSASGERIQTVPCRVGRVDAQCNMAIEQTPAPNKLASLAFSNGATAASVGGRALRRLLEIPPARDP